MSSHAHTLADFYQQMALLVRSNMPLPEGLREVGRQVGRRGFKDAVQDVAKRVDRGEKVSRAVAAHPGYFSPLHARLIAVGEEAGALSEMLFSVSRLTRFGHMLVTTLRDVVTYPLLTIHVALVLAIGLSCILVPQYVALLDDVGLLSASLPGLTRVVLAVGSFFAEHVEITLVVYLSLLAVTVWLLLPGRRSHAALLAVVNAMPGSWAIMRSMDMAIICRVWSACLRHGVSMADATDMCSGVVQGRRAASALKHLACRFAEGAVPQTALAEEAAFDRLLAMTFRHTPEPELSGELSSLAQVYDHRVAHAARAARSVWEAATIVVMSLIVGSVVIAVFLPMISFIKNLTA